MAAEVNETIKNWMLLSRIPFHSVGVMPFILGTLMAWTLTHSFSLAIVLWAVTAVVCILLATHYNGEYFDLAEDILSARNGKTAFSGGSALGIEKRLKYRTSLRVGAWVAIFLSMCIGLLLFLYYKTGPLTIPLGVIGICCGFFYSAPPFRWVRTGFGEALIGFNYGWLPVATAFYLQAGFIPDLAFWVSIPIGLSVFNIIFINEFPDYQADRDVGKRNMVVRLGIERAPWVYILATLLSWGVFFISLFKGVPVAALWGYGPVIALSGTIIVMLLLKKQRELKTLEAMCGLTIAVNLLTTLAYIIGFLNFNK
ncbi:MAG: prenyltransferase [Candidatus Omnitrophota bacterium]